MLKLKNSGGEDAGQQAVAAAASDGPVTWQTLLTGIPAHDVYHAATSKYLELWDDYAVAPAISSQFGKAISGEMVKAIRVDAAVEALKSGNPTLRREWMFRYRVLSPRALIKEYMFLTAIPALYEAKVELADELFWLSAENRIEQLTQAFNEAMGRNNISMELINEFLTARNVMLEGKRMISQHATATRTDATEMLDSVATKAAKAFTASGKRNIVNAMQTIEKLLDLPACVVTPDVAMFLIEYHNLLDYPEMTDEDALRHIIAEEDACSPMTEVVYGDPKKIKIEQASVLLEEMNTSPVLARVHLFEIKGIAGRLAAADTTADRVTEKLKRLAEKHERLDDVNPLLPTQVTTVLKTKKLTVPELKKILALANTVPTLDEVVAFMKSQVTTETERPFLGDFMSKYCFARFGVNVLPGAING